MERRLQFTHTPASPRSPIAQSVQYPQHQNAVDRRRGYPVSTHAPRMAACLVRPQGVLRGSAVEYADPNLFSRLRFMETQLNRWPECAPNFLEGEAYASIN